MAAAALLIHQLDLQHSELLKGCALIDKEAAAAADSLTSLQRSLQQYTASAALSTQLGGPGSPGASSTLRTAPIWTQSKPDVPVRGLLAAAVLPPPPAATCGPPCQEAGPLLQGAAWDSVARECIGPTSLAATHRISTAPGSLGLQPAAALQGPASTSAEGLPGARSGPDLAAAWPPATAPAEDDVRASGPGLVAGWLPATAATGALELELTPVRGGPVAEAQEARPPLVSTSSKMMMRSGSHVTAVAMFIQAPSQLVGHYNMDQTQPQAEQEDMDDGWWAWLRFLFLDFIHPASRLRITWDVIVFLLLGWVCFSAPVAFCFKINMDENKSFRAVQFLVDSCFMLDVLLNFRTGFYNKQHDVVRDRRKIAVHYCCTWFLLDAVSAIPYYLFATRQTSKVAQLAKAPRALRILKIMRLLKVAKLLRLLKVTKAGGALGAYFGSDQIRIGGFVLSGAFMIHLVACIWYLVATVQSHSLAGTWVAAAGVQDSGTITRYITALYFAVATMATVGYGDVVPVTTVERFFNIVFMATSVTIFAYFIGSVTSAITMRSMSENRKKSQQQAVDEFCRAHKFNTALTQKLRSYYSYVLERSVHKDDISIISGLTLSLQEEVVLHMYKDTLDRLPFFRGKHPQLIMQLVGYFKLEFYAPGDFVVRQGDVGTCMYFITEGRLEVRIADVAEQAEAGGQPKNRLNYKLSESFSPTTTLKHNKSSKHLLLPHERIVGTLKAGQHFGEYATLTGQLRTASVVAMTCCELFSLTAADLGRAVEQWPELKKEFSFLQKHVSNSGQAPAPAQKNSAPNSSDKNAVQPLASQLSYQAFMQYMEAANAPAAAPPLPPPPPALRPVLHRAKSASASMHAAVQQAAAGAAGPSAPTSRLSTDAGSLGSMLNPFSGARPGVYLRNIRRMSAYSILDGTTNEMLKELAKRGPAAEP